MKKKKLVPKQWQERQDSLQRYARVPWDQMVACQEDLNSHVTNFLSSLASSYGEVCCTLNGWVLRSRDGEVHWSCRPFISYTISFIQYSAHANRHEIVKFINWSYIQALHIIHNFYISTVVNVLRVTKWWKKFWQFIWTLLCTEHV